MHEHHDEGLILDLLETSASDAEAAALLDGCDLCIAEFAEQRSIVAHLGELDTFTMTPSERADLRSAVFSELDAGGTIVAMRPKRGWDMARLGTVAATLVAVVAVAGVFSTIGNGDGDSREVLDQAATAVSDDGDANASAEAPSADEERAGIASEESAADAATIAAPSDLVIDLGPVDRPTFEAELEQVRNKVTDMTESSGVLQSDADGVSVSCLDELSDPGSVRAIVTALVDGFEVEVYIDGAGREYGYAGIDCSVYDLP